MATAKQPWLTRLKRAIKTGDADTAYELLENAPAQLTSDEGGGDLPKALNISINPQYPLPDKAPEMGGQATGDGYDDLKTLIKALLAKLEGGVTSDSADDPDNDKDDRDEKTSTGNSDEDDEKETLMTGDAAWRAEVIVPGINLSRKVRPIAFRREVLWLLRIKT